MVKSLSTTLLSKEELLFLQESTLTLYIDHMLDKSRVNLQRLEPCRELENIFQSLENNRIMVEIQNI